MKQPTWTASIAEQLDELRIHFQGDTNLLASEVADSLERYRFALIRGIGQEKGNRQEAIDVLLRLSNLLGEVMPLSPLGEQIQDVCDFSDTDDRPDTRGYRSGGEIRPHTDPATLILLHCLTPARTGGESVIVNVRTIHDIIEKTRPDLLAHLYESYRRWRTAGVLGDNTEGPTPFKRPVFAQRDGIVSCAYDRDYINKGTAGAGELLTDQQIEALDLFDSLAVSPDLVLKVRLEAKDTLVLNNNFILHARTDYQDWPEASRRRHLLRVWVHAPHRFPVAAPHEFGNMYAIRPTSSPPA